MVNTVRQFIVLKTHEIKEKSRIIPCHSGLVKSQIPLEQQTDQLLDEGTEIITL